jgi:hypothetical protein
MRGDHIARVEERRGACRFLVGRPEGQRPLGKIMLQWIFKKFNKGAWTGLI